jgi:hypothetical protein
VPPSDDATKRNTAAQHLMARAVKRGPDRINLLRERTSYMCGADGRETISDEDLLSFGVNKTW